MAFRWFFKHSEHLVECCRYTGAHTSAVKDGPLSSLLGVEHSHGDISCEVSHQLYVARVFVWGFLLLLAELICEFDTSDRHKLPSSSVPISWHIHTAFVWVAFVGEADEYLRQYIFSCGELSGTLDDCTNLSAFQVGR